MPRYDLTGKVLLITGASGGIGSAGARKLVAKGAKVALVDLSSDAVGALAAQLPAGSALPFPADVTDVGQMAAAVAATVAEFGRLDVVWANAGIANDPAVSLLTADLTSYERVIQVDLLGVVRTIKPALDQVVQNKGQVVVTGSGYSFLNAVLNSAYGASKAGVEMLARSCAPSSFRTGLRRAFSIRAGRRRRSPTPCRMTSSSTGSSITRSAGRSAPSPSRRSSPTGWSADWKRGHRASSPRAGGRPFPRYAGS